MRYAERRHLAAGLEDSATGDRERMVVGLCIEIVARRVRCEREALFSHRDVKAVRREQLGERVAVVPSKWRRPRRRTDRVADCLLRGVTASWIAPSGTHALRTMRPAGAVTRAISAAAAGASGAKITPNTDSTTSGVALPARQSPRGRPPEAAVPDRLQSRGRRAPRPAAPRFQCRTRHPRHARPPRAPRGPKRRERQATAAPPCARSSRGSFPECGEVAGTKGSPANPDS